MMILPKEITIEPIRYVSDEEASDEIWAVIRSNGGHVVISEIAEKTCFPFEQIERLVNEWS